ncbi:methyltransferase [Kitasatospora sp. NPDC057015]|uniref:methyltransferase n=1 Tax=Kitasatospora sp. NPDC057015 TaxID=3346001 RepID=UPI003644DB28
MTDSRETDPVRERFDLIVNGPALFSALVAGLELDLFGYVSRHPAPPAFEDIRAFTGLPAHQTRVLLHALCATELLDVRDGGYVNSRFAEETLTSDGPDGWRHILDGWQRIYNPAFAHTTAALRAGTNTALADHRGEEPTLYRRLAHNPELEAVFHASMAAFSLRTLPALLEHIDLTGVGELLDVGGGDGTTARHLAGRFPATRITVLDTPSVSELADRAEPFAGRNRITLRPGDILNDPFPPGADAVLFSHVLEVFPADRIRQLLAKAVEALPSGGRVFVYGFVIDEEERRGIYSARLSLYLNVLASGGGMAYPAADYERWLREAGCVDVATVAGLPFEHGLTVATKP